MLFMCESKFLLLLIPESRNCDTCCNCDAASKCVQDTILLTTYHTYSSVLITLLIIRCFGLSTMIYMLPALSAGFPFTIQLMYKTIKIEYKLSKPSQVLVILFGIHACHLLRFLHHSSEAGRSKHLVFFFCIFTCHSICKVSQNVKGMRDKFYLQPKNNIEITCDNALGVRE